MDIPTQTTFPASREEWTARADRQHNFQRSPALFFNLYSPDSPEYKISLTHAAYPPIYESKILHFYGERLPLDTAIFISGHPVTITIGLPGENDGRAYYGIVVAYAERRLPTTLLDETEVPWDLIVEVHSIPGYGENWNVALPWILPPGKCVFVQPHAFLRPDYQHLPLDAPQYQNSTTINVNSRLPNFNPWAYYQRSVGEPVLPLSRIYPQHTTPAIEIPQPPSPIPSPKPPSPPVLPTAPSLLNSIPRRGKPGNNSRCAPCQAHPGRCDRQMPCRSCVQRNRRDECTYTNDRGCESKRGRHDRGYNIRFVPY
jgi:hypothetical protein